MRNPVLLALLLCASASALHAQGAPQPFALSGVTLVDVRTGELRTGTTVLVEGKRIAAVGKPGEIRLPEGTRVIEASGKYLIPGLIETHGHVHVQWVNHPPDTLAYLGWIVATGVTTFRNATSARMEPNLAALRRANEEGKILAPRIYISAQPGEWAEKQYGTKGIRETIGHFRQLGVDGIKVRNLPLDQRLEIIREARRAGMPVFGHTIYTRQDGGEEDHTIEAVRVGISGVSHVNGLTPVRLEREPPVPVVDWNKPDAPVMAAKRRLHIVSRWLRADEGHMQALLDTMVARGVWFEPTLTAVHRTVNANEYDAQAIQRYFPWDEVTPAPFTPEERKTYLASYAKMGEFVRRFHEAGGMVIAGSDYHPLPPLGVTEEMRLLVGAGLPPLAALQAASINAARALGWEDRIGSVEEGKLADLVLLDANPMEDILAVRKVSAVVADGRYLDRTALNGLLARGSTWVRKGSQR